MKIALSFLLTAALACTFAPSSYAELRQVIQGTQVHLTLLGGISSAVAKDGDPFVAVVAEPVYLGTQLLLPAGTRVNGVISTVERARHFSIFRGQAYMNVTFRTIEIDSRLIPVQMSIIAIEQPRGQGEGKRRKDVKIEEGQVIQEKHDVKGDIVGGAIGTGGGTLVGAVFSHVARGFGFGAQGQGSRPPRADRDACSHGQYHHRPGRCRCQRRVRYRQPLKSAKSEARREGTPQSCPSRRLASLCARWSVLLSLFLSISLESWDPPLLH
jgi:hypothetical protein